MKPRDRLKAAAEVVLLRRLHQRVEGLPSSLEGERACSKWTSPGSGESVGAEGFPSTETARS